jgi:hypothetical protein
MTAAVVRLADHRPRRKAYAELFDQAWAALPDTMRNRSFGMSKCFEMWSVHAGRVGEQRLLDALKTYLRKHKDLSRTGGPGLNVWLRAQTYEHWLPAEDAEPPKPPRKLNAPEGFRDRFVELLGETFVSTWLDRTGTWKLGALHLTSPTAFDRVSREFSSRRDRLASVKVVLDES